MWNCIILPIAYFQSNDFTTHQLNFLFLSADFGVKYKHKWKVLRMKSEIWAGFFRQVSWDEKWNCRLDVFCHVESETQKLLSLLKFLLVFLWEVLPVDFVRASACWSPIRILTDSRELKTLRLFLRDSEHFDFTGSSWVFLKSIWLYGKQLTGPFQSRNLRAVQNQYLII